MVVRDIKKTLEEFPFQWKQTNARIMDIGCGDGSMTNDVWHSYIPKSYVKIVGSDKSQLCIDFAKKYYESDRIQFMQLDIEKEIPKKLEASFDHVISSYTFHWLNMQESAFTNVFNLLANGGSCLLIFLGYFKPYEMYHKLSRTPKWREDLKHVKTKFMSPYHESEDPQSEITKLMRRIGFRDIDVKLQHKTFDYIRGVDDFNMLMKCLNPFDGLKDKWDDFMDDYVTLDPNAGTSVYQLLVVRGSK